MAETLEQAQARHRKEQRDLQGRITSKKKNATKKTRKFVNDECAALEHQLKERQEEELRALTGETEDADQVTDEHDELPPQSQPPAPTTTTTFPDDLATTLQSTTLSSQSPPQQPQQPQQKRNRQKERLARRAAEQAAAAEAAANEASSMTDHRGAERRAMEADFAAHALREHEIAPDGHCLFSAVADQLAVNDIKLREKEGDGEKKMPGYRVVRHAAADWIAGHRGEYEGFLEEGVEGYVARVRDTAEWGGEVELSALANVYGVEIRVVQGGGRVEVVKPTTSTVEGKEKEREGKTLWLAYYRHGYGLGEHYNSLRRVKA